MPVRVSRTNTSSAPLVSPDTRFDALEAKATYRPSALIAGGWLELFGLPPDIATSMREVHPATGDALTSVPKVRTIVAVATKTVACGVFMIWPPTGS
ncbi:hypothetical protein K1W54_11995 [Micromonospora sp. CPCC 205371]|nr:hypothetical protein [Micromonospora sp. CPCC 205371]